MMKVIRASDQTHTNVCIIPDVNKEVVKITHFHFVNNKFYYCSGDDSCPLRSVYESHFKKFGIDDICRTLRSSKRFYFPIIDLDSDEECLLETGRIPAMEILSQEEKFFISREVTIIKDISGQWPTFNVRFGNIRHNLPKKLSIDLSKYKVPFSEMPYSDLAKVLLTS